jgi:hypothetical protein
LAPPFGNFEPGGSRGNGSAYFFPLGDAGSTEIAIASV